MPISVTNTKSNDLVNIRIDYMSLDVTVKFKCVKYFRFAIQISFIILHVFLSKEKRLDEKLSTVLHI